MSGAGDRDEERKTCLDKRAMRHVPGMSAQMPEIRHSIWEENGQTWAVCKSKCEDMKKMMG